MPCAKLLEIEIIEKGLTFVIDDEYFFSRASFIAFALLYKINLIQLICMFYSSLTITDH